METEELESAGRNLVAGYKASGMRPHEIASLLVFGLKEVSLDPETKEDTMALLALMGGACPNP